MQTCHVESFNAVLQKMIKDLVRNGDIDFNRAREIYGERFVEGIKPHLSVKEEL